MWSVGRKRLRWRPGLLSIAVAHEKSDAFDARRAADAACAVFTQLSFPFFHPHVFLYAEKEGFQTAFTWI